MGILSKLFGSKEKEPILTDDEKELREYEANVYRAESGVVDTCHAEYIITAAVPTTDGKVMLNGSVTEGTFKVGDEIKIIIKNDQELTSKILAISVFMQVSAEATEGQIAEFVIEAVDTKMVRRNDIVKKIIKE